MRGEGVTFTLASNEIFTLTLVKKLLDAQASMLDVFYTYIC